jgi:hypothetical protein
MRSALAALALILGGLGTASADAPRMHNLAGGPLALLAADSMACWSEPPDLNGMVGSSEQIQTYGLQSEIANDFVAPSSLITKAAWGWAWYDMVTCDGHPPEPGFNLRFYQSAAEIPGSIIADLSITTYAEQFLDCRTEHGVHAMYQAAAEVAVDVVAGQTYWFGMQVKDHEFPPQAGRLGAGSVTGSESVFLSAFFGYPEWTPTSAVWGVAWDASQELECGETAVQPRTWGRIKRAFLTR